LEQLADFYTAHFLVESITTFGRIIGHITAFYIARALRSSLVNRFVDENVLREYDRIISGGPYQSLILFLIYFLPFFPDDEISYLVGLSKMPKSYFVLANLFGHLGGSFSLALIGSGIDTKDPWFWFLFLITLAGFPVIWFFLRKNYRQAQT
jgi:uncharacterized membrane protein YdjX (TVP38/TMEM64 family)